MVLTIIQKPPLGAECNRCGDCCLKVPCQMSRFVFQEPQCPAIVMYENGTTSCGMVENFSDYMIDLDRVTRFAMFLAKASEQMHLPVTGSTSDIPDLVRTFLGVSVGCDSLDREGVDSDLRHLPNSHVRSKYEERVAQRAKV